jgi:hypothetical protein
MALNATPPYGAISHSRGFSDTTLAATVRRPMTDRPVRIQTVEVFEVPGYADLTYRMPPEWLLIPVLEQESEYRRRDVQVFWRSRAH